MGRKEEKGREQKECARGVKPMFKLIPKCGAIEPKIVFHILLRLPGSSKPHFLFRGEGLARPGFDPVETRVVSGSQAARAATQSIKHKGSHTASLGD